MTKHLIAQLLLPPKEQGLKSTNEKHQKDYITSEESSDTSYLLQESKASASTASCYRTLVDDLHHVHVNSIDEDGPYERLMPSRQDEQSFPPSPPARHIRSPKKTTSRPSSFRIDRDAVAFGLRMAVLLTIAALFVLIGHEHRYPQGMWVLISVLFVCWFPSSLDAASVIEKILQRLIGTFLGATIGLMIGFLSLFVLSRWGQTAQTVFLAISLAIVTFAFTFSILQFRVGRAKIVQKFNYASILFLLTFYICVLPFGKEEEPRWSQAIYRVANVIVGCIIGALGSILIVPRSSLSILRERIQRQIKLAGESSEAVLHAAADTFSGKLVPAALTDEMMESPGTRRERLNWCRSRKSFQAVNLKVVEKEGDAALDKYETAIQDWKVTKAFFSVLRYDPFLLAKPDEHVSSCHSETADALARALRLQTTVVLLDGIIRNDTNNDFNEAHLTLFADCGTLIREMLTIPLDREASDLAAEHLLEKLSQTRFAIVQSCSAVGRSSHELPQRYMRSDSETRLGEMDSPCGSGRKMPKLVPGSSVCALLFLQLVEHLVLRALGLYKAWKQVDESTTI